MTLRELIQSVDSEQYSESPLYQKLCETKPEYGSNRHIQVKLVGGEITITNVPKFIITMDGVFRLGMVNQHKHLLKPGDIYKYDDGFHDDFNVSEELKIEYYD